MTPQTMAESTPIIVVTGFLLTYLLHSTFFVGAAWLIDRTRWIRSLDVREALWKTALFGGLLTASLQFGDDIYPARITTDESARGTAVQLSEFSVAQRFLPLDVDSLDSSETNSASVLSETHVPRDSAPLSVTSGRGLFAEVAASWPLVLVACWLFAVFILTARFSYQWTTLSRMLRGRVSLVGGLQFRLLRTLLLQARDAGTVRLSLCRLIGIPLALSGVRGREIVLPEQRLTEISIQEQRSVLAHELAHLIRRDGLWLKLRLLLRVLFFFQPLNFLACRRLQDIAEMQCDDWAANQLRTGEHLASVLEKAGRWSLQGKHSPLVTAMGSRGSSLKSRVARLVSDEIERGVSSNLSSRLALPIALVVLIALLGPSVYSRSAIATSEDKSLPKEYHTYSLENLDVRPNEHLYAQRDPDYTYVTSDQDRFFDTPGRLWQAKVMPRALDQNYDALKRNFDAITFAGDLEGLWVEIERTISAWDRSMYFRLAFTELKLEPIQRREILRRASLSLKGKDWPLWLFLKSIREPALAVAETVLDYAVCASELELAWNRADILADTLSDRQISEDLLPEVLEVFSGKSGDYGKSMVFLAALERLTEDTDLVESYFATVETIGDEHFRRGVLISFLGASGDAMDLAPPFVIDSVLSLIPRLQSEEDRADVLKWMGKLCPNDQHSVHGYLEMVNELESTALREHALKWFFERSDVGEATLQRAALIA